MNNIKGRILKPLLFMVSVLCFAVVKINKKSKNKKRSEQYENYK